MQINLLISFYTFSLHTPSSYLVYLWLRCQNIIVTKLCIIIIVFRVFIIFRNKGEECYSQMFPTHAFEINHRKDSTYDL
jgi:hypothetical protein